MRLSDPLAGTLATGVVPSVKRQLVLEEEEGVTGNPVEVLPNNSHWNGIIESTFTTTRTPLPGTVSVVAENVSELPRVGSTEQGLTRSPP